MLDDHEHQADRGQPCQEPSAVPGRTISGGVLSGSSIRATSRARGDRGRRACRRSRSLRAGVTGRSTIPSPRRRDWPEHGSHVPAVDHREGTREHPRPPGSSSPAFTCSPGTADTRCLTGRGVERGVDDDVGGALGGGTSAGAGGRGTAGPPTSKGCCPLEGAVLAGLRGAPDQHRVGGAGTGHVALDAGARRAMACPATPDEGCDGHRRGQAASMTDTALRRPLPLATPPPHAPLRRNHVCDISYTASHVAPRPRKQFLRQPERDAPAAQARTGSVRGLWKMNDGP